MFAQIDPAQGFAQLSSLVPFRGVAWPIPKSIIFVDTFDEYISISTPLRDGLSSSMAEYPRIVVWPFACIPRGQFTRG
jgi:hypothetical protein